MALLADIEEAFQEARQTLVLREAFRLWQTNHPEALADFEDLEALIELCRRPDVGAYDRKSDVLAALCLEARSQEGSPQLAGLLICWLLLPGLWELSNTLSPIGCLSLDEMDGELIAGLWNVAAQISPGSRKVAGQLISGAHNKAVRRIVREWAYSRHFEPTDEIAPVARNSSGITESDVIVEAKCNGVLTDYEARLIEASRLQDVSLQELANLDGVSYSGLRLKRWRAEARLAAWLEESEVPSRRIVVARETNHAHVSPCVSAGLADPSISDGNGRNTTTKGGIAVGLGPASRSSQQHSPEKDMNDISQVIHVLAADPGMGSIIGILEGLRNALMAVLITLSMVALTYAGVRYVMSVGDPTGVERAKGAVKAAVIGLALALLAPIVIAIVRQIVGA